MDPYIERSDIWPDFHDRFITYLCGALQPLLLPRYAALTQERLYVVESDRTIRPDVSIKRFAFAPSRLNAAVLEIDPPTVFEIKREEIREPLLYIVEPAAGNHIVTAIEVLSPANKNPGPGRLSYAQKRDELWNSGTNLVEIDLLLLGENTVHASAAELASLKPWNYVMAVTRCWPSRHEIYPVLLQKRLPRIGIPLASDDNDVALDLQAVFTRCWDEGPYPALLQYGGAAPKGLTADEGAWCEMTLAASGLRPA